MELPRVLRRLLTEGGPEGGKMTRRASPGGGDGKGRRDAGAPLAPGEGGDPRYDPPITRRIYQFFQYKIFALMVAILIVLLGISLRIYSDAKKDIERQFSLQQLIVADQASSRIQSYLDLLAASIRISVSFLRTVGPNHPGRMSTIAGLFNRLSGRVRVSEVGIHRKEEGLAPPPSKEFLAALSRCPAERTVCLLPVREKGRMRYLLALGRVGKSDWLYVKVTVADLLRSFVTPVQSGLKGRAWLVDPEGMIYATPRLGPGGGVRLGELARRTNDKRLRRIRARMLRGERGHDWHYDLVRGNRGARSRRLTAFSPFRVGTETWTLAVTVPSSRVLRLVRRSFRKGFLVTGFGFIVVLSSALFILDRERRRIRAEETLAWSAQVLESNLRLRALFDGITDGICILDRDYRVRMLNRGLAQMLNRRVNDLLGAPWSGEGKAAIPSPLSERGLIERTFQDGERGFAERSVPAADGRRRELELYTYPIFDSSGKTVQVILYLKDVTERKELQRQVLQGERLSVVGKMSAQVAHEIRNPLSAINLNAELLGDELRSYEGMDTAEAWNLLRSLRAEVDILRQVTDDYLKFVRMPRVDFGLGNINEVVEELVAFHSEGAAVRGVEIETDLASGLPDVEMDETQLRIALQNLVVNAFDAMPKGGRLTIRTRFSEGGVDVDVIDTGTGIRAEDQPSLFTPFFTTKANGTGLGLALTQQIVTEHGGTIRFASHEGVGTTFHIHMPAAHQEART